MGRNKKGYTYEWPRPGVTVDIALFTVAGALQHLKLQVLLIERDEQPWAGMWALPGGFVHENEDLDTAAQREMQEETGIDEVYLEQVATVGTPGRDTRGHIITVVYMGLTAGDRHQLAPRGDARQARWFDVSDLPALAFDHAKLLQLGVAHLRRRLDEVPICFELLPEFFTLSELQSLTEAILGREVDRRNFRRKVAQLGFITEAPGVRRQGRHRPARLWRFTPQAWMKHAQREKAVPFSR